MKVGSSSTQAALIGAGIADYHSGTVENCFDEGFQDTKLPDGISIPKLNLIHATPDFLHEKGLLTEEMLETYSFIGLIRNPIERFLSAWIMEVIGGYFLGNSYLKFVKMLEEKDLPYIFTHSCSKDYVSFEGKLLPNICYVNTKHLATELQVVLPEVSLTVPHLKKSVKPTWAARHYKDFLSSKHLTLLKSLMQDEIIFYETITGEIV